MNKDLKNNVSSGHIWLRLLYMILFAFVLQVAVAVFWVVAIVQFLFTLLSGNPNAKLAPFSDSLVKYISQCLNFECFLSEEKPFPFSDFPEPSVMEADFEAEVVEESSVIESSIEEEGSNESDESGDDKK